ncbi:hypothetical protein Q7P37_001644 [Cladosporium fusiforme]
MLVSVFYDTTIECNAVTPWLQGTLAAFNSVSAFNSDLAVRLCMHLWSGLTQSFIQQPVSVPLVKHEAVTREDEYRLLFLFQSSDHARMPLCQWKSFGKTPFAATDIEVRHHKTCKGHQLLCDGIHWKSEGGLEEYQALPGSTHAQSYENDTVALDNTEPISVCFEGMNRDREAISENSTRNILTWLRPDGCAEVESKMWKHEWMQSPNSDSDESDECLSQESHMNEQKSDHKHKAAALDRILVWIARADWERRGNEPYDPDNTDNKKSEEDPEDNEDEEGEEDSEEGLEDGSEDDLVDDFAKEQ